MGKTPLSSSVDLEIYELLERLANDLGPPKNKIIESSIEVFNALPIEIQLILKSNRQKDRLLCLDLVRAVKAPFSQDKFVKKNKSAKSG